MGILERLKAIDKAVDAAIRDWWKSAGMAKRVAVVVAALAVVVCGTLCLSVLVVMAYLWYLIRTGQFID